MIFKNTFWLGVGTGINKLLSLALVMYAARVLGAEGYGKFSFALAFASLLMIFSDLGLSHIITREFAREEKKEDLYSLVSLKIVLACATFFLLSVVSLFTVEARDVQVIILSLSVFLLANSLLGIFYSFFHARQKMEYEAWLEALQAAMIFGFGLFVLLRFPSPEHLSYAYVYSALVALGVTLAFFHWKVFPLKLKWDFLVWKKYLAMSWPLALVGLFGMLYSYTDSVMLGYWGMLEETGWYNAAYKIVTASLVPMGLIGASFYPALSKFSMESKEAFQKMWNHELETMIALALPLVIGGIVLAEKIVESFYSFDFAPAALALQILSLTVGVIFLYRPMNDALIVFNQQKKTFWVTALGALVNVVLNVILIPAYSLYGAAVATVVTHALVLCSMTLLVRNFTPIKVPFLRVFLTFCVSAFAISAMYLALQQLLAYDLHLFPLVLAGAAAYALTFFVLRQYIAVKYFKHLYA